jgi:uncharacterized protein (TIGR01777 family)
MLIALTGSGGFVGRALARRLWAAGHTVVPVSREPGVLPGVEAVVHLGGESIAGRWTAGRRRAILQSRVEGTRRLVDRMRDQEDRPAVFLCASGAGVYGDRPGETLTEESAPGRGFRTEVCLAWEAEARRAQSLGIRTVMLRFGAVLDPGGGILSRLLPWHRRGLSFVIGGAGDPFPWIGLGDALGLVEFCLGAPLRGPVNGASPETVTQEEFARLLAAATGHRLLGRMPGWALRLALGEMARALVDRQHVLPARALGHGFVFRQDLLASCLAAEGPAPASPVAAP